MESITGLNIEKDVMWIKHLFSERLKYEHSRSYKNHSFNPLDHSLPVFDTPDSYSFFVSENRLSFPERALLTLALVPHIDPYFFTLETGHLDSKESALVRTMLTQGHGFKGMLPTGLTFLFIIAGRNAQDRLKTMRFMMQESVLAKENVIVLEPHYKCEPMFSGKLGVTEKYLEEFLVGKSSKNSILYSFQTKKHESI